jgi:hypothetical protein
MRFAEITLSGIVSFTSTEEFRNNSRIPITPLRARSQSLNPRGRPDDVVLIIAYDDNNELIGYIGALPDRLNLVPGKRIAWNSGWWIDPEHGRDAAMPLFYKFIDRWNKNVLFADLTPLTYQIACKTGFFIGNVRMGIRGYLRMPLADILPAKNKIFTSFRWIFTAIDFIFNLLWELRLTIWKTRHQLGDNIKYEFIKDLDTNVSDLIFRESAMELVRRGEAEFDWIRDYPWILEGKPDINARRYHFTSHTKRFKHQRIKISQGNVVKAFMIVTLRDNHLKVPYLYCVRGALSLVLNFLIHHMISVNAKYISVFREDITGYLLNSRAPFIWKKRIARYAAVSKELSGLLPDGYILQDGDGDVVFT